MRQACNHPSLVTKNSIEDQRDALDPTPQRARTTPTGSGAPSPSASHADGLADLLDGMSLNTCALCSASASTNDSGYCKSCDRDMERYASLSSSTKIKRTLHILEGIKRESYEAIEAEERDVADEQESDDLELGNVEAPKKSKLGMKKTIIFSQVSRAVSRSSGYWLTSLRRQFTSMFDVLEPFLRKGGYRYVRCASLSPVLESLRTDVSASPPQSTASSTQRRRRLRSTRSAITPKSPSSSSRSSAAPSALT
jgi:SNF2 family DNA or RNA helicase